MTSLTFIRREILAVESCGVAVCRYAVRAWDTALVDPVDLGEAEKTRRILDLGMPRLGLGLVGEAIRRPGRFLEALRQAWRLGWLSSSGVLRHLVYLAEAARLRAWCEADGIAHLHVHFGTNSATVALLCRVLGGPPFSFTVHGPEEFDDPKGLALGEKVKHAKFAVAISRYGRSQLWRWAAPGDWPKVEVIRCGLGPDYIDDPGPIEPCMLPRFLNIGRLSEQKGQLLLVEAAARLRDRGRRFEVSIIGGGPLEAALEARIGALGLGSAVRLLGWKSGEEVRAELLGSRALVLPSFAEGLPVVIMEALALGRPVIATTIAGIPELVRPGESGWLVPAGAVDELVDAMEAALDSTADELRRMGEAGRARVVAEHDARVEARRLLDRIDQAEPPE